jgi:hypothetical protein
VDWTLVLSHQFGCRYVALRVFLLWGDCACQRPIGSNTSAVCSSTILLLLALGHGTSLHGFVAAVLGLGLVLPTWKWWIQRYKIHIREPWDISTAASIQLDGLVTPCRNESSLDSMGKRTRVRRRTMHQYLQPGSATSPIPPQKRRVGEQASSSRETCSTF